MIKSVLVIGETTNQEILECSRISYKFSKVKNKIKRVGGVGYYVSKALARSSVKHTLVTTKCPKNIYLDSNFNVVYSNLDSPSETIIVENERTQIFKSDNIVNNATITSPLDNFYDYIVADCSAFSIDLTSRYSDLTNNIIYNAQTIENLKNMHKLPFYNKITTVSIGISTNSDILLAELNDIIAKKSVKRLICTQSLTGEVRYWYNNKEKVYTYKRNNNFIVNNGDYFIGLITANLYKNEKDIVLKSLNDFECFTCNNVT